MHCQPKAKDTEERAQTQPRGGGARAAAGSVFGAWCRIAVHLDGGAQFFHPVYI